VVAKSTKVVKEKKTVSPKVSSKVKSKSAPKKMPLNHLHDKARYHGINPVGIDKTELIRAIQRNEGYSPCFGTTNGSCPYETCCFRPDCLKPKK
jgi:hypothetical protein